MIHIIAMVIAIIALLVGGYSLYLHWCRKRSLAPKSFTDTSTYIKSSSSPRNMRDRDHVEDSNIHYNTPVQQQTSYQEQVSQDSLYREPFHQEPLHQEPLHQEPLHQEPPHQEPLHQEPLHQEPTSQEQSIPRNPSDYTLICDLPL